MIPIMTTQTELKPDQLKATSMLIEKMISELQRTDWLNESRRTSVTILLEQLDTLTREGAEKTAILDHLNTMEDFLEIVFHESQPDAKQ